MSSKRLPFIAEEIKKNGWRCRLHIDTKSTYKILIVYYVESINRAVINILGAQHDYHLELERSELTFVQAEKWGNVFP